MRDIPMTKRTQVLVTDIFMFAIRNNAVPTQRETTGERPTFFVKYSGHTAGLTVHISPNGWRGSEKGEVYYIFLSPTEYKTAEEIEARMEQVLARMTEVMNVWEEKQHE